MPCSDLKSLNLLVTRDLVIKVRAVHRRDDPPSARVLHALTLPNLSLPQVADFGSASALAHMQKSFAPEANSKKHAGQDVSRTQTR